MSSMKFRHNIALVVGINDYQDGVPILKTPVNDAQTLAKILQTQHGYKTYLGLNQQANRENLIALLENVLPKKVEASDRLLFYFAGHGIALNGEDGPEGYLLPQDARLGDVTTYLSMAQVHNALHQLPCSHFLGILDCCFAGSFRWSGTRKLVPVDLGVIHKERFDRFIQDPAWQIITSAAHDQTALDAFDLQCRRLQSGKHSPFAAALIEALQGKADAYPPAELGKLAGDGVITATELYLYLRDRVEVATEARTLRQTPGIHSLKKHDKGEYIFLAPGHPLNLPPAPPLDESKNPYRGLRSFEENHRELFFGRSELIEKLHNFVKTHPLTVVLGASGSGKSSLVKAGLIPQLKQDAPETHEKWCILAPVRPGEAPFQALNNALATAQLATVELPSQKTLAQSIAIWAKQNPDFQLLIFIDQSEEIITLCPDEAERQEFFQQILQAIDAHRERLRVVLCLRSDFEPQIRDTGLKFAPEAFNKLGHAALKNRWQGGRFIVPAMTRGELREAIEKPAEARVMYFQPHDLVEQIIEEVADMPGALPLLSFALSELYLRYLKRQREAQHSGSVIDRALTQEDYHELGGVIQSLTQRADEEYQALVQENSAYEQVICHVMLRMVALGGGELARRRVPLSELEYPPEKNVLVKGVIERFSKARLLVEGQDAEGKPYVEPAHDALVRGWGKLQTWLKKEKNLALQRRLTPSAFEWKERQQASFLWNANPYLDVLKQEVLSAPENNWLNQTEVEFVQSSLRRKRNNHCRLVATVTGVILALSGFALFAGYQWRQAEIGIIEALTQFSNAKFTADRNSFDGLIDALEAGKRLQALSWSGLSQELQDDVLETLAQSVYWVREQNRWQGHQSAIQNVSFSPDGQMLATASYNNTIKLWRRDGSLFKTLKGHTEDVMSVSFSPDGKMIASGSVDGTVRLWDSNGNWLRTIPAHPNHVVHSVSFSPDGRMATASDDGTAKLWRSQDGRLLHTLKGHREGIWQVKFSPSGDRIVTVSDDTTAKLWSGDGKMLLKTLRHSDVVVSVDFSSDGQLFATSSMDGVVHLWSREGQQLKTIELPPGQAARSVSINRDGPTIAVSSQDGNLYLYARDGRLLNNWVAHATQIPSVAFSPDGKTLASVGFDSSVKLWQTERSNLTTLYRHQRDVFWVEFSPDGKRIASASADGTVRIWNRGTKPPLILSGHHRRVNTVRFSPNGNIIASGGDDRMIKLWRADGTLQRTLKGHRSRVMSISFSPDGQTLASASPDGTAKLWRLDGKKIKTLKGHKGMVLSIAFSPDGQTIATAGEDTIVRLWNSKGQLLQRLAGHKDIIRRVAFSQDGKTIVTASDDRTVNLWSRNGVLITTLKGHLDTVISASISPNGEMIASASTDKTIKLWKRSGALITTLYGHKGSVYSVNFSPDSKWLASGSADGVTLLWNVSDVSLNSLLKKGCQHVHDYLQTPSQSSKKLCNR